MELLSILTFLIFFFLLFITFKKVFIKQSFEILYKDKGTNSYVFENKKYKIRAKPDIIIKDNQGEIGIVEYKSRKHGIYQSDINQLIATALAVKVSYPSLSKGKIINKSKEFKVIDLSLDQNSLFKIISKDVEVTRKIKSKTWTPSPCKKSQCKSCFYFKKFCKP